MVKTTNFSVETDPKLACTCGSPDCDKRTVTQEVLDMLQLVRDDAGRPLQVTSGGRCPKHQDEVKRRIPMDHQKGVGVDIRVQGGFERGQLVALGLRHGFNAIGVAKTFVHLGYRAEIPEDKTMVWEY